MKTQSQLGRQAIKYLASTMSKELQDSMEENQETLKYAYGNSKWAIAEAQGLIERPKARQHTTYPRSHKQDLSRGAYARIKSGESLYFVAKDLCIEQSKLRNWLQRYTEFTTIGALRGAE